MSFPNFEHRPGSRLKAKIQILERERNASRAILGLNQETLDPTFEHLHGCHVFSAEQDIGQHNETQPANTKAASTANSQPGPSFESADRLIDSLMQVTARWAEPPVENTDSDDFIDTDFQGPLVDAASRGPSQPYRPASNTGSWLSKEISGTNAPHGSTNDTDLTFTQMSPLLSSQHLTSLAPVPDSESLAADPLSKASPEVIFTRILLLMKKAGFEDMDAMVQAYYTAKFRYESVVHWAQKRSRGKRLGPLLTTLSRESPKWPVEQAAHYQDAILRIADGLCGMNVNAHATRSDESPGF
ncbi:transcriptional regulator [Fusarium circinatum]|uniref:Transcriptional regulator n=1 Tax=Fusarium circinatum TaxID=48490 RepID=A0A8H5TP41_FUSCI|nr:transcriptional regulator [Fusarium circinatum]